MVSTPAKHPRRPASLLPCQIGTDPGDVSSSTKSGGVAPLDLIGPLELWLGEPGTAGVRAVGWEPKTREFMSMEIGLA